MEPPLSKPASNWLLYAFVAVGAMVPAVVAVSVWAFLRTERGAGLWSSTAMVLRESGNPGVAELRGIGCEQAVVTTIGAMMDTQSARFSDEDRAALQASGVRDRAWVLCMNFFGKVPSCEDVAATHGPFSARGQNALVMVSSLGSRACAGVYAPSGEFVADFSREAIFGDVEPSGAEAGEASP